MSNVVLLLISKLDDYCHQLYTTIARPVFEISAVNDVYIKCFFSKDLVRHKNFFLKNILVTTFSTIFVYHVSF